MGKTREEIREWLAAQARQADGNDIKVVDHPRLGRLKFTIGVSRSGKSTYASRWVNFLEDNNDLGTQWRYFPRAIVCSDDIRLALHGKRFNRDAEPMVWAINTYMCKALLSRGHDVLVDGTHTTEDSIWRVLNIDADASYVVIDTDHAVCKLRAMSSLQYDLVDKGVIDRQSRQLRELQGQEGGIEGVVSRIRERVRLRWGLT